MLTCFCGSILISNGKYWHCPIEGELTQFEKGRAETHKGVVIPDKRPSTGFGASLPTKVKLGLR